MNYTAFSQDQFQEVVSLFNSVFSASEGENEGEIIGQLVSEMIRTTDSDDLLGFVCAADGSVIGSIFFSRLDLPSGKRAFILSPVAISSQMQGKGIGQRLIKHGIQQLKSRGVELLLTYGDPNFYSKVGFEQIGEDTIKAPQKLTYPEGWLAQSLTSAEITPEAGTARCVAALNKQKYW